MRKPVRNLAWVLALALLAACAGCGAREEENITFTAEIESVSENSLLVITRDDVGFDRASVDITEADMDFAPEPGQRVVITILPEIRESYPVQVTAVKVRLA